MIKAVAIDDERNALEIIQSYAEKINDIELGRVFTDPVEGLKYISEDASVQMVFLDIRMAKMNGLSLAAQLPKHIKIVLTTAYSDYAMMGFELGAVDYLLKPFSFERFQRSVDKVRMILDPVTAAGETGEVKKISPKHDDILLVKADLRIIKIRLNELLYAEGAGNYLTLHMLNKKLLIHTTMRAFEEKLLPYQFVRVHKSFIVSFLHVDAIEKMSITVAGKEIPVSESYKPTLTAFLNTHFKPL